MTEPGTTTTPPEHPVVQLAPEDRRVTPVTRIIWVAEAALPPGESSEVVYDLRAKANVILIHESLATDPRARRAEMRRLRQEIHGLRAGRLTAWGVITLDGLRRFGLRWLPSRASSTAAEHLMPLAAGTAVLAAGAVGGSIALSHHGTPAACQVPDSRACIAWHQHHHVHATLPDKPLAYLGAYEATSPGSYSGMETFAATCGRQPNVALYYSGWYERFQIGFALAAAAHGAIPLVQINPVLDAAPGVTGQAVQLAAIAGGSYDTYLTLYADQVATYGKAVIIGFGHEMNGPWSPWGYSHQTPQDFVAAWQHIVNVFRKQGADNVTWLWTVNKDIPKSPYTKGTGPVSAYWPGSSYVTWVGVDGYYQQTDDTWDSVFGPTISQIRQFTQAPLLIAETAIGPANTEPWQLNDIYASIRRNGYLGLVWFDENKSAYLSYRLEGDPRDSAVFRELTKPWRLIHERGGTPQATGAAISLRHSAVSLPSASSRARRILKAAAPGVSLGPALNLSPSRSTRTRPSPGSGLGVSSTSSPATRSTLTKPLTTRLSSATSLRSLPSSLSGISGGG